MFKWRCHGHSLGALSSSVCSLSMRETLVREKTKRPREFFRSRFVPPWRVLFFVFDIAHPFKRMTRFCFSGLVDRMIGGGWDL